MKSLDDHARGEETHMANPPPYPGTPRWVKVLGIIVIVVALLLIVVMMVGGGGGHDPGRHAPSGDVGAPLASVPEGYTPPTGAHTQL
jgi:hypothetical protein